MASFYEENLGLLLQYTDLFDVIRYKHTDEDAMDYEIAKWVTDTYIQHHKILNPWPYGRKLTDYRIIVGDNGKLLIMINIHTANLRPTKSLGVRETESMAVGD